MKYDLDQHPYFKQWTDPISDVTSYILTKKIAPIQQSSYYTNQLISLDGEWLWFNVAFPPAPMKMLACVNLNPKKAMIKYWPSAAFSTESPAVRKSDGRIYFCSKNSIYSISETDEEPKLFYELPGEFIQGRTVYRLATHLSFSADDKYLLLDGEIGNEWFIGIVDLRSMKLELLGSYQRNYDHGQFSPLDSKVFMISEDVYNDRATGKRYYFDHRTWIRDIEQKEFYPINPSEWAYHNSAACHEWWSADGKVCWVDYEEGVFVYDINLKNQKHVWKRALCHAHCDDSGRFYCGDESPYVWDDAKRIHDYAGWKDKSGKSIQWAEKKCQVLFYDTLTSKEKVIVSDMQKPYVGRGDYHLDPHPQILSKQGLVLYTTTVIGDITLAITDIEKLI